MTKDLINDGDIESASKLEINAKNLVNNKIYEQMI